MRATKHFQYGLLDPQKKEKKIKQFTRESSQQVKRRTRNLVWVFILISTTSKEIKLTNFLVFLKVYQTHKKKTRKINLTSMDNTMKEYEHRRLACEHECKVGEKYVLPQA